MEYSNIMMEWKTEIKWGNEWKRSYFNILKISHLKFLKIITIHYIILKKEGSSICATQDTVERNNKVFFFFNQSDYICLTK